jgi:hypothetical protein
MYADRPELEIVLKIRKLLENICYRDIPISNVYRTKFISDYWAGLHTDKPVSNINIFLSRLYFLLKLFYVNLLKKTDYSFLKDRILVETFATEPRLKGFWFPLIEMDKNKSIVLIHCDNLESEIDPKQLILNAKLLGGNALHIINWHYGNFKRIKYILKKVEVEYGLNSCSANLIYNEILREVLIIEQYFTLFSKVRPKAFIAIDDQHVQGAVISQLLNIWEIPTYTHVHGAIGIHSMIDFTPLNAKYVFCWGDYMVNLYKQNGVDSKQLLKVGCQRSNVGVKYSENEINEFKNTLEISANNLHLPIVLFGFTRLITSNWISDILEISNQLSQEFQFLGRLHPSSSIQDLKQLNFELNGNLIISESSDLELAKHISVADFVIVDSSTMGFDALLLGKDVIILDSAIDLKTQDVMFDVIQNGACYLCRNAEEVIGIIQNNEIIAETRSNAKVFLEQYFYQFGDKAAKEIIRKVEFEIS